MTTRPAAACGAAFVLFALAGNSLTESAVDPDAELDGPQARADLTAYADSTAVHLGIALEILGLLALAVFASFVAARTVRHAPVAAIAVAVGATSLVAIKLGSGAALLAGIAEHDLITDDVALGLVLVNGAAFVLGWLPMALLVAALAVGLRAAGVVGAPTAAAGLLLAGLGLAAALAAVRDVGSGLPVPFLLSLLWLAVVSVRLVLRPDGDEAASRGQDARAVQVLEG